MTLQDRIKVILSEKNLKQTEFANSLGISANYVNLLVNGKKNNLSETLAKLIEETYGYSSEWILTGNGNMYITTDLNSLKLETIKKIKKMSDSEVAALLAFMTSLETIKHIYPSKDDDE
ncbi:helix-turn-helix domain-containing protein [Turicibacter sanguinis]|uniref:Helix-turn-helix domain-containing protein n=1 Tax=Turicibacter sanguinis TaxID=154288 RepID=A0A9X5AQN3_9FIRM|nr:helix-turn-helix transcriptional regulator [Turicibacter sanguinis]MDB8437757.1 helix-turn-helix transcriptional regulator [Turicibacter sanguinis]MTK22559.1 helix-turn-helix domain-containing protein [Turicibacter sanguinis]MTK72445.1 helix-turn-helix domain-containing protein [Turicibacter sanguinis]CUN04738.1 Predicted transcriptional regulator [Turicibacter sanguinis]